MSNEYEEEIDWTLNDFLNSRQENPTKKAPMSIGDKVSGDKIERQINMGKNSTYIENQNTTNIK